MSLLSRFLTINTLLVLALIVGCGKKSAEREPVAIEPTAGFDLTLPVEVVPKVDDLTIVLGKIPLLAGGKITKGKERTLKSAQGCVIEISIVSEIANLAPGGAVRANLLDETGRRVRRGEDVVIPVANNTVARLEDTVLRPYFAPIEKPGRYSIQLVCTYITTSMASNQVEIYRAPLLVE